MKISTCHGHHRSNHPCEGSSLVFALFTVFIVSSVTLFLLVAVRASNAEVRVAREELSSSYVCEAGLAHGLFDLNNGGTGNLGSEEAPIAFGDSRYWVEAADLGANQMSLTATGLDDRAGSRVELVVQKGSGGIFSWGAFGDEFLEMESNAFMDSYDSSLGTYDSQDVNSSGSNSYALQNGDAGSNGDVELSQNAMVQGDALSGPSSSTTLIGGNVVVSGSTGQLSDSLEMPGIVLPSVSTPGTAYLISDNDETLAAGTYYYSSMTLNNNSILTVTGPATIVLGNMTLKSGAEFLVDASAGPVDVYVVDDFVLNSNTELRSLTYMPSDLRIQLLSDNVIDPDVDVDVDFVDFESNAKLYGTVYAPSAAVEINSNFELFGSIVARSLHLDSNSRIHYDESLAALDVDADPTYASVGWRALPYTAPEAGE